MYKIFPLFLISFCCSCQQNFKTEKHQNTRNNCIDVHCEVKEIQINDVFISDISWPYLIDNYLIIADHHSEDKLIHLFDKQTFKYITSTANRGLGPNEITNMGRIAIDNQNRIFFVSDNGKQKIFGFELDSVLTNESYIPKEKARTDKDQFPRSYQYVNDTLSIGVIIEPINNGDYRPVIAKWNMNNGEIKKMKYSHPEIEKKRISFAISIEDSIYVECYWHHDLMTICTLDGDLKYNIYGPKWNNRKTNRISFYSDVVFAENKIIALYYDGEDTFANNGTKANYPNKIIVFDLEGNYLKTLDIGYNMRSFCFDKKHNRLIMFLNDEIQFAYLNIEGIV